MFRMTLKSIKQVEMMLEDLKQKEDEKVIAKTNNSEVSI